jgi:hypothetical protein
MASCSTLPPEQSKTSNVSESAAARIEITLKNCPSWEDIKGVHDPRIPRILIAFKEISKYKTQTIERGILRYLYSSSPKGGRHLLGNIPDTSKLFVLNRYLFEVPRWCKLADTQLFGGWIGTPSNGSSIDMMWPLRKTESGSICLVGTFSGYNGEDYDALSEFSYFKCQFPRRHQE